MDWFRKAICFLLVFSLVSGFSVVPVRAAEADSEDPLAVKNYEAFGAPVVETEPVQPPQEEPEAPPAEELSAAQMQEPSEESTQLPEDVQPEQDTAVSSEEPLPGEIEDAQPEDDVYVEDPEPEENEPEESEPEATVIEEPAAEEEQSRSTLEGMPLYDQNAYPGVRYGTGTLAKNGCSITALAMVATYMTGHTYYPDELARYFGGQANNSIDRLALASEALGLVSWKAENWHRTRDALREGKIAIIMVGKKSAFTQSQHFLVLTGITEEGMYLVNDPNALNYNRWDLMEGFKTGFPEGVIVQGYSGAWIYDKDAMPEEVPYYYEPELDRSNPRYPDLQISREDMELLARVVWAESRGESPDGQQAVAEVVLNRLASENRFPDNLYDVIYGEGQFRSVEFLEDAKPGQAQYEAIERAIYGPNILPEDVYYFATYAETPRVWGAIGGHIFCY